MPIYKSPSTSIRSVDVLNRQLEAPSGTPALVVGSARRGPAFTPVTLANFDDFIAVFGNVDKERFGPLAMKLWLKSRAAGTYYRLLGAGDCKKRDRTGNNSGRVNRAGFVVGSQQVQQNGFLGNNSRAGAGGPLGRSYVLGCFMSESAGSTIFSSAGIQAPGTSLSVPIIRGMLLAPSGVHLTLNTEAAANNSPSQVSSHVHSTTGDGGLPFGDILLGEHGDRQNIIVILNGFTPSGSYSNSITASLDPQAYSPVGSSDPKPIREAFNTDPTKIEEAGHYLKLFYDIPVTFAVPTASNITNHVDTNTDGSSLSDGVNMKLYQTAFLLTSSMSRNSGSATSSSKIGVPNFENFENRFTNAYSPMVFSQKIEGKTHDLFQLYAKDDGAAGSLNYKVTIQELDFGVGEGYTDYPKFDIVIRRLSDPDEGFGSIDVNPDSVLEVFEGVTLDPSDPKYISRVIGDIHTFYDFDKKDAEGQKIVVDGNYQGSSRLVRVKVAPEVDEGLIPPKTIPAGFRGLSHLVTSGSTQSGSILTGSANANPGSEGTLGTSAGIIPDVLGRVVQPPVPLRESLFLIDADGNKQLNNNFTWGFQAENKLSPSDPNSIATFYTSSVSYLRYMPDFNESFQNVWVGNNHGTTDVGGCVLDADRFNNNSFTLERVEVITSSLDLPDPDKWIGSAYRRDGKPVGQLHDGEGVLLGSRLLRGEDFRQVESKKFYKFTFPLVGGFDGTNMFDYDKSNFTNNALIREVRDLAQGGRRGPTVSSFIKAIEVFEDKDYPLSLMTTPGVREPIITREFLSLANRRADVFYISDIEERGTLNEIVTGSLAPATSSSEVLERTKNVRSAYLNDPDNSTFGAAFYPDVRIQDSSLTEEGTPGHRIPPTVAVLGIMSKNKDHTKLLGPKNGRLSNVLSAEIVFSDKDIDEFYQSGINLLAGPSVEDAGLDSSGPFLRSQNTFQRDLRPLSRISTRRMMLFVRRRIKDLLTTELFEPMDRTIYTRVRNTIEVELASLQAQGMFKFAQVQVPFLSQDIKKDLERNVIRAKVLIRPNDASEALIINFEEPV